MLHDIGAFLKRTMKAHFTGTKTHPASGTGGPIDLKWVGI